MNKALFKHIKIKGRMLKPHWMISLVRLLAIIFALVSCFMVFWYTPFYSNMVVKVLNTFVPIEVDEIAAQSQQMAALTDKEDLEPGSNLWIARQAYLKLIEDYLNEGKNKELQTIQARYVVLKQTIIEEQKLQELENIKNKNSVKKTLDSDQKEQVIVEPKQAEANIEQSETSAVESDSSSFSWLNPKSGAEKALMLKYTEYLNNHPVDLTTNQKLDQDIYSDIAQIQSQNAEGEKPNDKPYAIVVLGGGLTLGVNRSDIIVNDYTRLRLEKTLEIEKQTDLPIVLSGVEAPYMQQWLALRQVKANLLENRSMNTCENSRFSSLLLQKKGGAPTVILITDRYHMPRTRRLFALNGIRTIPVEAPMPTSLSAWRPSQLNYDHSRRANYELLATIRDVLFGSSGCREVP